MGSIDTSAETGCQICTSNNHSQKLWWCEDSGHTDTSYNMRKQALTAYDQRMGMISSLP